MGYVPVSTSVLTRLACALALGVALVAAGCAGSSGGGLADGHMESALPGALQKIDFKPGELKVHVTTVRKSDGKTREDDLEALVVDNDTRAFEGTLPFSLTAGDYTIALAFIFVDPVFGDVTIATIDPMDVTIVEGAANKVDFSGQAMNFPNDDGDVFTNLEEAEAGTDPGTIGPLVALLANTSYVDYNPGNPSSEASNTEDTINDLGGSVSTFTDISAVGIAAALVDQDAVVLPEVSGAPLLADMDALAEAAIAEFVQLGGTLIATQPSASVAFLNGVFGLTMTSGGSVDATLDAVVAADTPFADGPPNLAANNGTSSVTQASLPQGSRAIYHDGAGNVTVAVITVGTGRIVLLGWDWYFDAADSQDDWFAVLKSTLRMTAPTKVALLADTAYVDYNPGATGSEASNMEGTINRTADVRVTPFKGITPEIIGAALLNRKVLVITEPFGGLETDLSGPARDAIVSFVKGGGTLLFSYPAGTSSTIANSTFGFSLVGSGLDQDPAIDDAEAAGTRFAGGPKDLSQNDATSGITVASLPPGSKAIYKDSGTAAAVVVIPFEAGQIIFVGWDWFDAAPVGSQDNGWLDVLSRAVRSGL